MRSDEVSRAYPSDPWQDSRISRVVYCEREAVWRNTCGKHTCLHQGQRGVFAGKLATFQGQLDVLELEFMSHPLDNILDGREPGERY